jgi:hypothetical protein
MMISLSTNRLQVFKVFRAIVAALAAGFRLGHGSAPAASTLKPAQVTRQGLLW